MFFVKNISKNATHVSLGDGTSLYLAQGETAGPLTLSQFGAVQVQGAIQRRDLVAFLEGNVFLQSPPREPTECNLPIVYNREIRVPADFPAPFEAFTGDAFQIVADVCDDDPTKTNTGTCFSAGSFIFWDAIWGPSPPEWVVIGGCP